MPQIDATYLAHQRKRWMRPDAHLFIRPDWRRFVRSGFEEDHPFALYERKYSQDQPRVPAGSREGGQWASDGSGNDGNSGNSSIENGGPADVQKILDIAKRIAAGGYTTSYLKCLDICSPILERPQPRGVDFNKWDFHRCMSACTGK